MAIDDFEELRLYRTVYQQAMNIFDYSQQWPKEERYALTDQIRRSCRGVCSNVAEAWSKRRSPDHSISKLSDAEGKSRRDTDMARLRPFVRLPHGRRTP